MRNPLEIPEKVKSPVNVMGLTARPLNRQILYLQLRSPTV